MRERINMSNMHSDQDIIPAAFYKFSMNFKSTSLGTIKEPPMEMTIVFMIGLGID